MCSKIFTTALLSLKVHSDCVGIPRNRIRPRPMARDASLSSGIICSWHTCWSIMKSCVAQRMIPSFRRQIQVHVQRWNLENKKSDLCHMNSKCCEKRCSLAGCTSRYRFCSNTKTSAVCWNVFFQIFFVAGWLIKKSKGLWKLLERFNLWSNVLTYGLNESSLESVEMETSSRRTFIQISPFVSFIGKFVNNKEWKW